ncbi:hypothetical protein RRG08_035411 [Elysia crispata]|uniref:Poly [ADP-ribose] polymerase n=1 Tax=Elysia crispata TaxID=231223 RepID=A0AAE0Y3G4_9GAST|nr:hypothetical protein RRG08_035411 [Elysia crispata]
MAASDQNYSDSSCESDCDENEYDDFSDDVKDSAPLHPLLEDDIQRLQSMCGEHCFDYRVLPGITDMTLHIFIPTSVLERDTAAAWNLNYGEPLTVSISLERNVYLDVSYFQKIEVFQASSKSRGGAVLQLQNIALSFCQSSLRNLTNENVSRAVSKTINIKYADVLYLVEMGFLESEARNALKATKGLKEDAVALLLDCENEVHSTDAFDDFVSSESNSPCTGKEVPSLENGFLVQLYQYLNQRLLTLNGYCPICDNAHELCKMAMLKPYVCHRELCIFSFTTLGLMSDVADSVETSPKIIDLLLHLTTAAALSERHDLILSPYPAFVDPAEPTELAMHEKCKKIGLLRAILAHMPPAVELFGYDRKDIQAELEKRHPLCFPLLRWIIHSNRSHIVVLPEHQQIKLMGTKHQFLMRSMPPLEERKFIKRRAKHGSTFAFHGSPIENWHAIIREGLILASGTSKQLHGAAYGQAIYLSPSLQLSMGYSQRTMRFQNRRMQTPATESPPSEEPILPEVWSHYLCGKLCCIALCEVVNDKLKKNNNEIWTCTDSSSVCTRLFFVFDQANPPSKVIGQRSIHTGNHEMHSQIQNAIRDILR